MSAIDNAFIRAYTTERTSQSSPSKPAAATAPVKAIPAAAVKQAAAPPAPLSLSAARAARAAASSVVASEVSVNEPMPVSLPKAPTAAPAPHFRPAKIATSVPAEPMADEVERNSFRSADSDAATQSEVSAADEPIQPQRAAYEVDQFEWPALCDTLLTQLAGGLDHLAGELVTESALGRKVIAITGLRRGEGRTTLVLALARRLAAGGVKVLLADADTESPQIAAQLGLDIEQGWDEAAADGLTIWDTMVESIGDQLTVLPFASRRGSALRRRESGKSAAPVRNRFESLRPNFDLILVDAGPLEASPIGSRLDKPAALAGCDAALLVCDVRQAKPAELADAQRRLLDASVTPLGVVENFCQAK